MARIALSKWRRHAGWIALLWVGLLAFSLAVYDPDKCRWIVPGSGFVRETRAAMGVPSWLILAVTRPPSELGDLPWAEKFGAEWRLLPATAPFAIAGAGLIAAFAYAVISSLRRRLKPASPAPLRRTSMALISILALATGAVPFPTDPEWIGAVLVLGLLSAAVAFLGAWANRPGHVLLLSALATALFFWSYRIGHLLQNDPLIEEIRFKNEGGGALLIFGSCAIVGSLAVLVVRLVKWIGARRSRLPA